MRVEHVEHVAEWTVIRVEGTDEGECRVILRCANCLAYFEEVPAPYFTVAVGQEAC